MNLLAIFDAAYAKRDNDGTFATEQDCRRAGIAAVVRALRDEICHGYAENSARDLANQFNEILASAGEDKAAGDVYPDGARIGGLETTAPAASGAPAADPLVCEWTARKHEPGFCATPHGLCHINYLFKFGGCWCGKPIKFVEAK